MSMIFDVLKKMNDLDSQDYISRLGVCPGVINTELTKAGTLVTMGAPSQVSNQIATGTHSVVLLVIDNAEFSKIKKELEDQNQQ